MPIISIEPGRPDLSVLSAAAEVLREGGVVGYPTETTYGLGADALNPRAVGKVFHLKGRSRGKPISVLVADRDMLRGLVEEVPESAARLMDAFWPGALTLVFRAAPDLPPVLLGGGDTLAVRISSNPIAEALVVQAGRPLTASSANRSGARPACSAQEVLQAFGEAVGWILDGGRSTSSVPSTLVDVSSGTALLLREGAIPAKALVRVIGRGILTG